MSRHVFLSAVLSLTTLAACVEIGPEGETFELPTEAERPEIGQTYDVATGTVEEDLELSLAALRDPTVHAPLPGTPGPSLEAFEGAHASNIIFGTDTRVRVTPTTSFPATATVQLTGTFPDGWVGGCSGSMIRGKYVLTAGHCVFDASHGGWATSITAAAGRDIGNPGITATATKLRSVTGWTSDGNNDYDYGLITLSKDIGAQTGTYCMGSYSDSTVGSAYAYIYGYPADKAANTQWGSGGPIEDYDSTMLYYDIDTFNGMSGSGVYRFSNGVRCVFGIHTGASSYWGESYNTATRINNDRYNLILSWMNSGI